MQTQFETKEAFVEDLARSIATTASGFDYDWVYRQLNTKYRDRVMIETDGTEVKEEIEDVGIRELPGT
jgi:hypothetical protein